MFSVKEELDQATKQKTTEAIRKVTGRENFKVLYAYKELNLYFITLITHYALGFTENEVAAVAINSNGSLGSEVITFNDSDSITRNLWGKICLDNGTDKLRVTVPGMVPSTPGIKYLPVEQTALSSEFDQWVRKQSQ